MHLFFYCKIFYSLARRCMHAYQGYQTRQSGWNSLPMSNIIIISYQLKLHSLNSETKLNSPCFFFASRCFLANNVHFMVKLIDKAIVINVKIHKNERKRLYLSNKEGVTSWDKKNQGKFLNLYWRNSRLKSNPKSKNKQTDDSCTKMVVGLCYII